MTDQRPEEPSCSVSYAGRCEVHGFYTTPTPGCPQCKAQLSSKTVVLDNGKYTFAKDQRGMLTCDRYGEAWREFLGDHAVTALFDEVERLRAELAEAKRLKDVAMRTFSDEADKVDALAADRARLAADYAKLHADLKQLGDPLALERMMQERDRLAEAERLLRLQYDDCRNTPWDRETAAFLAGAPSAVPGKGQPGNVPSGGRADDRTPQQESLKPLCDKYPDCACGEFNLKHLRRIPWPPWCSEKGAPDNGTEGAK